MRFKFYPESTVLRVRHLKEKGVSSKEIAKRFNLNKTTILRWSNDIPSLNSYHLYSKGLREKAKERSTRLVKNLNITKSNAKILASILYWCEGSKYPSSNFVAFSNSDVELMKTFLALFRAGFSPKKEKIKASLQLHTTHDIKITTSFWSRLLDIPENQFHKPTITKPTNNMKRRDYRGTCTVRYYDVYLLLEMMGIFERFSSRINK